MMDNASDVTFHLYFMADIIRRTVLRITILGYMQDGPVYNQCFILLFEFWNHVRDYAYAVLYIYRQVAMATWRY